MSPSVREGASDRNFDRRTANDGVERECPVSVLAAGFAGVDLVGDAPVFELGLEVVAVR
jgi:hypothetical protein